MNVRRTPEQVNELVSEIVAMYGGGFRPSEIAVEVGISVPYTYTLLQRAGITTDEVLHSRMLGKLDDEQKGQLILDYQDYDQSVVSVLKKYDISHTQLYAFLCASGVSTRRYELGLLGVKDLRLDNAIQMYKDGYFVRVIVEETGIHQPQLHAELARREIPMRRPRKGIKDARVPDPPPTVDEV